jgi:Mn2+/Fe2+ NRAMP family transporter
VGGFGFWLLIVGVVIALAGTILANQDGWARMFADATLMLLPARWREASNEDGHAGAPVGWVTKRSRLKQIYVVVATAALPLLVFFLVRRPVDILSVGGIVAAAHTPVVVFLTLYLLNKTRLPRELRPGVVMTTLMVLSGLFFLAFAVLHLLNLVGINLLPQQ